MALPAFFIVTGVRSEYRGSDWHTHQRAQQRQTQRDQPHMAHGANTNVGTRTNDRTRNAARGVGGHEPG